MVRRGEVLSNDPILFLSRLFRNIGIALLFAACVFAPFTEETLLKTELLSRGGPILIVLGGFSIWATAFWIMGRLR